MGSSHGKTGSISSALDGGAPGRTWRTPLLLASLAACGPGQIGDGFEEGSAETDPPPIVCSEDNIVPAYSYGAKVKGLLVGQGLTENELARLETEPDALRELVSGWLDAPMAETKLLNFFASAFQQTGFGESDLARQFARDGGRLIFGTLPGTEESAHDWLFRNIEESFPRTAFAAVTDGRPFDEMLTTNQFMVTTAMLVMLAYNDELVVDDSGALQPRTLRDVEVVYQRNTNHPLSRVLNPQDPAFFHFYLDRHIPEACESGEVTFNTADNPRRAYEAIMGTLTTAGRTAGDSTCTFSNFNRVSGDTMLEASDFGDWRLVTFEEPEAGTAADQFFQLERLRGATKVRLHTPRVGFFTTPAFFAVWGTNEDNQARVTLNQTLITAYGRSIDDSQTIIPAVGDALDGEHANPNTFCYGCHKTLDPMRQFFRRDYTYSYHQQQDSDVRADRASFAWDNITGEGDDMAAFGALLSSVDAFATAWVDKVCQYATSAPCPRESDEFQRIETLFRESNLNFRVLLEELFSSPLVTSASCIPGGTGDVPSVARSRHFCTALTARLGISDVCGMEAVSRVGQSNLGRRNRELVPVIPDDTFSRGDETPITLSDISLFSRASYEKICSNVASTLVRNGDPTFSPSNAEAAIDVLVENLMGLPPNDPRHVGAESILRDHFAQSRETENAQIALRSTFMLACMSPSVTGVGF